MPIPIDCQTMTITGELQNLTRDQAAQRIVAAGGEFSPEVSHRTTLLVTGAKPVAHKIQHATSVGAAIITEDDLMEMLEIPRTTRLPGLLVEVAA
jgi:DNA ligase (NAD+)